MLLTVGLERFPFDRLVRAADRAVEEGLVRGPAFGQIGTSAYTPRHFPFARFLPFDELRRRLQEADVVVCHAGVGTILLAQQLGKLPLVLPRRAAWGEQLDDHQLDLALRLAPAGRLLLARTEEELGAQLARYDALRQALPPPAASSPEREALERFLCDALGDAHGP